LQEADLVEEKSDVIQDRRRDRRVEGRGGSGTMTDGVYAVS
jgi:hypothetical protein